jgi:hypothetical protein
MTINVVLWGLGAMATGMAKILLEKESFAIAGAICKRAEKNGRDLGEVHNLEHRLGLKVTNNPQEILGKVAPPSVVLHTTNSFLKDVYIELEAAMNAGHNVVSIAEELAYPEAQWPDLARDLDRVARKNGVTLLGTGINPGFVLDSLIIMLTAACADIEKIHAKRINDLSSFGPTVMKTQGVGTAVDEFTKGLSDGSIVGHIGFAESIRMIADAVGWKLDEVVQTREPIISKVLRKTPYVTVSPGRVAGCRHIACGISNGKELITLEHPQQIQPEAEGIETGDFITIYGTPAIHLSIKPEIPGGLGTMAVAVNMIPKVVAASPGLVTMKDLPIPSAVLGDLKKMVPGKWARKSPSMTASTPYQNS